jgi:hypothetical protein
MASGDHTSSRVELYESGLTVPSDSEIYSANNELSESTSSSPLILYKPPTIWGILRGAAINLVLPFVNGLMLGFGELFAHEAAFRLGWSGTKVPFTRSVECSAPCLQAGIFAFRFGAMLILYTLSTRSSLHIGDQDPLALAWKFERCRPGGITACETRLPWNKCRAQGSI